MKILETIPIPGNATERSWVGYPRECLAHPERNRPEAVAWIIERYTKPGDLVWDPMAGAGTVLIEGNKLARCVGGWDIDQEYRGLWSAWEMLAPMDPPALIAFSPSFGGNHAPGDSDAQRKYSAQAQSRAGDNHQREIPGHLAFIKDQEEYDRVLRGVLLECFRSQVSGGLLSVIVRNRIKGGVENGYVRRVEGIIRSVGYDILGGHPRAIARSYRVEQREKLKPGQPWIRREWTIMGRKP